MTNEIKDGGCAFPCLKVWDAEKHEYQNCYTEQGMSLRDYFAAAALQGWYASMDGADVLGEESLKNCAKFFYETADAMIAVRDKGLKE